MKFLLDENIGKRVAEFLESLNHSTLRVREISPGIEDYQVLELATEHNAILITSDKDFGELVFKENQLHSGVIFLRLEDQSSNNKIKVLMKVLSKYRRIEKEFITIIEKEGRFRIRTRD